MNIGLEIPRSACTGASRRLTTGSCALRQERLDDNRSGGALSKRVLGFSAKVKGRTEVNA